ncbi:hypothetical protein IJI18_02925 [Candidatus Saccharibacteria bacterium]|nr:hypothetical protein [Candidatus Saccharibacteria bacterium]
MTQTKKKKSTKTAAKKTAATKTHKKAACRTYCKKSAISSRDRMHIYIVTALSITAAILLCADAAMMIV